MLFTEWNMEDALKIEREEGIEIGVEKAKRETVRSLSEFFSVERIAEVLKMPVKDVTHLLQN